MIHLDKEENSAFFKKSIHYLQATGFENIKADIVGCEKPKSYLQTRSGVNITPDIVAIKNGRKYFFDISLKSEERGLLKSKWLFLDALCRKRSNYFRIITTKGHYKFTENMLDDINLGALLTIKI
ncbi:MAG: hypothetical protein ACFCUL_07135 [Flavobacteriaceae bacterium]